MHRVPLLVFKLRRAVPALDQLSRWRSCRVGDSLHKFRGAILPRLGHLRVPLSTLFHPQRIKYSTSTHAFRENVCGTVQNLHNLLTVLHSSTVSQHITDLSTAVQNICMRMWNLYSTVQTVTAGKCNWRHFGWSVRLVGFPQCYPACRFLTNKILSCSCVGGVSE